MEVKITLYCPRCSETNIVKNGRKTNRKQNYLCNSCNRQFLAPWDLSYPGCFPGLTSKIELMLVRGVGIRDIAKIERVSIGKVLKILVMSNKEINPKLEYYDKLEIDEFWTYVGSKNEKVWLIYAYHRKTGEIVAWVWGKRNLKTARRLRNRIKELGLTYGIIYTDNWCSFITAFKSDNHIIGKKKQLEQKATIAD